MSTTISLISLQNYPIFNPSNPVKENKTSSDWNFLMLQVDLEDFVARPDRISGADVNAICQEAGMHAVRENRYIVLPKDFEKGYKNNIKKDESEHEFYK